MKTVAIVLAVCFVALVKAEDSEQKYTEAAKYVESCYRDIGITEGFTGDLTPRQEKCGIACLFKALKIVNEDGSVNVDIIAAESEVSAENIQQKVNECKAQVGDVKEDYVCELSACLQKVDLYSH